MPKDKIEHTITFIPEIDGFETGEQLTEVPAVLPVLPLRNLVAFPQMMLPVVIGRERSLTVVNEAYREKSFIGVFAQMDAQVEHPQIQDMYRIGVVARVAKVLKMPDGNHTAFLDCVDRILLKELGDEGRYDVGQVELLGEDRTIDTEIDVMMGMLKVSARRLFESNPNVPEEARPDLTDMPNSGFMISLLCTSIPFTVDIKQGMLKAHSLKERARKLLRNINNMQALFNLRSQIEEQTQSDLNDQQREYFLHQEMKLIQEELGGPSMTKDVDELREKAAKASMPEKVRTLFNDELAKLQRINPQTPDYNVQLNYLQTLMQLPWENSTKDNMNLQNAENTLNKDHYGMEKVKERILEHLAVLKLRGDMKSPIICLYGPPGVGKTSLGRSIAKALKRKYVRMSLGGVHDESEIRGHRRTYIGAMPGRIIKNMIKAGSANPVFILDEIDKISGQTVNGDPSSALLEVLDPEQNNAFHDNFLDIDYDLSKVMFIATANDISQIPRPLLDRMELIEVSGYCTEEKTEIARRHLVPKTMEANGLAGNKELKLTKGAIEHLIEHYTRESGVRGLEKELNKVFRKMALSIAAEKTEPACKIDEKKLVELIGTEPYNRDQYQGNGYAGVVTGLAWTSVGGEILYIETSASKAKGGKLTLTGNLGDVMKESAILAIEYIKSHAEELGIDVRFFDQWGIHVHVPEGATPKDGPSAGITMVTSIASCITQRKIRAQLAMTGEITLRGKVLPVGGIKEKILAAKRAGISHIILCQENRKDIEKIPELYLKGLTFHYVDNIMEVLDFALLKEKVDNAKVYKIEENDVPATTNR